MGLGDLTKQLAKEALSSQVDDVMDSLRGPDASSKADSSSGQGPAAVILAQLQAMQNALKDDQELLVHCSAGSETIRVFEIFAPSPQVLVLSGIDPARAVTRIISSAESLQLVCKPAPVKDGAKPVRLRFITPKPKGG